MESLHNVLNIIQQNCWMASIDLKDAFYSVGIHPDYKKYFRFIWKNSCFEFQGMPNGYSEAMRSFTVETSIFILIFQLSLWMTPIFKALQK